MLVSPLGTFTRCWTIPLGLRKILPEAIITSERPSDIVAIFDSIIKEPHVTRPVYPAVGIDKISLNGCEHVCHTLEIAVRFDFL